MHRRLFVLSLAALFACSLPSLPDEPTSKQSVYDFSLVDLDGKVFPLSAYKGKLLLIVNLASQSVNRGIERSPESLCRRRPRHPWYSLR